MRIKTYKTSCSDSSVSSEPKSRLKRERRRGTKNVPKDAHLIPNIPHEDYFSDVTGVYYHFKKMEWRTICKDPFNNSKRWQKTFGINKYGFYEAKGKAEMKSHEIAEKNQLSKILSRYSLLQDDPNLQTSYFTPFTDSASGSDTLNHKSFFYFNPVDKSPNNRVIKGSPNGSSNPQISINSHFLHTGIPLSYPLDSSRHLGNLVPVLDLKHNKNIFVNLSSFPYPLGSLGLMCNLKHHNFN